MAGPQPLRVAVIIADPDMPAGWIVRLVEEIAGDEQLSMCAVIGPDPPLRRIRSNAAFDLMQKIETSFAARRPAPDTTAYRELVAPLPKVLSSDEEAIRECALDVIVDLSGNHGLTVPASAAARGVWFTDSTSPIAGAAGLKPLLEGGNVSAINLFRRTAQQPVPTPIASAAVDGKFVAARNAWFLEEKSVALIMRELRRCAHDGKCGKGRDGALFVPPTAPSNAELARYLKGMLRKLIRRATEKLAGKLRLRPGMFHLRVEQDATLMLFSPKEGAPTRPDDNSYYADPFLVEHDGQSWVLFERYDYPTRRGSIWAGRIEGDRVVDRRVAIDPGYHLSFPFPIEHEGSLYLMPESCAMQRLEVWKCVAFPDQWELHATALEGSMIADSALLELDGEWWIFANLAHDPFGDVSSELHLFRTSGPDLAWIEPHRLNPVVFDSRMARNAGRIHRVGTTLYRPAQDNSHGTYGYGLRIMEIEAVGPDEYRERSARHLVPDFDPGVIGIHHVDRLGDRVIFDVRERLGGVA